MAKIINREFVLAATKTRERCRKFLLDAFRPQYGDRAEEVVDEASRWLARNIDSKKHSAAK